MSRDPWDLVLEGKYQEAVNEMEIQMAPPARPAFAQYSNRAAAYLCLRDYDAAARDYATMMTFSWSPEKGYEGYGICQWCQKKPAEAIASWKQELDLSSLTFVSSVKIPLILLYAGLRTHDRSVQKYALHLLRRKARPKHLLVGWPRVLTGYMLGRVSQSDVRVALTFAATVPVLQERYQCQMHFYLGVKGLLDGDLGLFQNEMRATAQSWYGYLEFEYYLATWEVDQQFPEMILTEPEPHMDDISKN